MKVDFTTDHEHNAFVNALEDICEQYNVKLYDSYEPAEFYNDKPTYYNGTVTIEFTCK